MRHFTFGARIAFASTLLCSTLVYAQTPIEVEWYQPEIERTSDPKLAKVVISGKTRGLARVKIDGPNITFISEGPSPTPEPGAKEVPSPVTKANELGYFEIAFDLPPGLIQIPVRIQSTKTNAKSFIITVDVSLEKVAAMNTPISENKPPAAAKSIRVWLGAGTTYQKYSQTVGGVTDVSFVNLDSPSLLARLGYWGKRWGGDLFFRDAPGKIDAAVQPFTIASTTYHWQTIEARGFFQPARNSRSRMLGLPSQWQYFFGMQQHQMPFLDIDVFNVVSIRKHSLTMATLGAGILLGQERKWSYEAALNIQYPIAAAADGGNEFTVSSPLALDLKLGATYKFARNWRVGLFGYIQSHSYSFEFTKKASTTTTSGDQSLFYSTFDLHLGWEY